MSSVSYAHLLAQELAKFPQLDPRAVQAVASQEGLGGGIGDNGTSFGPFQLHQGGAYPSFAPQQAPQAQQWAWTPAGIDYALKNIASVASGLKGAPAVQNIVQRFERPANPQGEVAGALKAYGGIPVQQAAAVPPATTSTMENSTGAGPAMHGEALQAIVNYLLGK